MMSDTRGWKRDGEGAYYKDMYHTIYYITPTRSAGWWLRARGLKRTYHKYIDDAKRAAHAHARETK